MSVDEQRAREKFRREVAALVRAGVEHHPSARLLRDPLGENGNQRVEILRHAQFLVGSIFGQPGQLHGDGDLSTRDCGDVDVDLDHLLTKAGILKKGQP